MSRIRRIAALVVVCGVWVGAAALPAAETATVATTDPSGCWSGTWCSHTNGHHGPIRANICQIDACTYRVHFSGRYLGLVPFAYTVPMTVTGHGDDGRVILSGQSRLLLFGHFCCTAEITDCDFVASYTSSKDQGQFTMRRR